MKVGIPKDCCNSQGYSTSEPSQIKHVLLQSQATTIIFLHHQVSTNYHTVSGGSRMAVGTVTWSG